MPGGHHLCAFPHVRAQSVEAPPTDPLIPDWRDSPRFPDLRADVRRPADRRLSRDRLDGLQQGAVADLGTVAVRGIGQDPEDGEGSTACPGIGDQRSPGGGLGIEVDLRYCEIGPESVGYLQQL